MMAIIPFDWLRPATTRLLCFRRLFHPMWHESAPTMPINHKPNRAIWRPPILSFIICTKSYLKAMAHSCEWDKVSKKWLRTTLSTTSNAPVRSSHSNEVNRPRLNRSFCAVLSFSPSTYLSCWSTDEEDWWTQAWPLLVGHLENSHPPMCRTFW